MARKSKVTTHTDGGFEDKDVLMEVLSNNESDDNETGLSAKKRDDVTIREALFQALEEQQEDDNNDSSDDSSSSPPTVISHLPFIRLFVPSNTRPLKKGATTKDLKESILSTVACFHKSHTKRFFAGLKPIVDHVIQEEAYIPDSYYPEEEDGPPAAAEDVTPDDESSSVLQFLCYATQCVQAHFDAVLDKRNQQQQQRISSSSSTTTLHIISEVFEVAVMLHDILLTLQVCGPDAVPLQTALVNLCEAWWHAHGSNREQLLYILPILVTKALDGTQTDVKRLDKIREAFYDIDFNIASSDFLRALLLKLASSPTCLKLKEGQRFISFLFLLDASFVKDLHQAMKYQIPNAKKFELQVYGQIYKKAWKYSQASQYDLDDIQQTIEQDVLQDLMYALLHIEKPKMFKALLVVLEPFHEAKKSEEIQGLLYRTYGPILRRALHAANPGVRINAAAVLGEVFPLHNPQLMELDDAFAAAVHFLMELLDDKNHKVRVAGGETVAKVLAAYWDVLDAKKIYGLLNLVLRNASDKAAYQVRASALNAFSTLLACCPQSHPLLTHKMLPGLCNLIHDNNKHVRLAAVNMLLKIKAIKGMSVRKFVPTEHLKARLVAEAHSSSGSFAPELLRSPVAKGITRLLLSQYIPQGPNVTAIDQIKRTISFLDEDPDAALVFYANLCNHLPTTAIAKLTAMLLRCLNSAVETEKQNTKAGKNNKKTARKRRHEQESDSDNDQDDLESGSGEDDDTILTAMNTRLMATLAEVVVALWESIKNELECENEAEAAKVLLTSNTGTIIVNVLCYFERVSDEGGISDQSTLDDLLRISVAILQCAGYLNPQYVEGLVPHISSSLKSMSISGAHKAPNVSTASVVNHVSLLCRWEMAEDVALSLVASILSEIDDGHDNDDLTLLSPRSDSRKRRSSRHSRRSSFEKASRLVPNLQPYIAIKVLQEIFTGSDPNQLAARDIIMNTPKAREKIGDALEQGTLYAGRLLRSASIHAPAVKDDFLTFVLCVCEVHGRFVLHNAFTEAVGDDRAIELNCEARHLLDWATNCILPVLTKTGSGAPLQELDLSHISFVDESMVSLGGGLKGNAISEPQAPSLTPLAPAKKKGNRNATPERLGGAFEDISGNTSRKDSKVILGDSCILLVRTLASDLLRMCCAVFSEWLNVTGGAGNGEILKAAINWCSIVNPHVNKDDKENSRNNMRSQNERQFLQVDLLKALARLSIELGKSNGGVELFREVFLSSISICDELQGDWNGIDTTMSVLVQSSVAELLRSEAIEATVDAVLAVVHQYVVSLQDETSQGKSTEIPASMIEVLVADEDCGGKTMVIAAALQSVASHKAGSELLAEKLVKKIDALPRNKEEDLSSNQIIVSNFDARCLWFLVEGGACKDTPRMKSALKKLSAIDKLGIEAVSDVLYRFIGV